MTREPEFDRFLRILKETHAEYVALFLPEIVRQRCFGCQNVCPSQLDHNYCLMSSLEDQIISFSQETAEIHTQTIWKDFVSRCGFSHRFELMTFWCCLHKNRAFWWADVEKQISDKMIAEFEGNFLFFQNCNVSSLE